MQRARPRHGIGGYRLRPLESSPAPDRVRSDKDFDFSGFSRPARRPGCSGETIAIDTDYVPNRVAGLAKDADLSRFIL